MPRKLPIALTETFANDAGKALRWDAFRRKGKLSAPDLADVIGRVAAFLQPIITGEAERQVWHPETGWIENLSHDQKHQGSPKT